MQSNGIGAYSNNLPTQPRNTGTAAATGAKATTAVQSKAEDNSEKSVTTRFSSRAARLARLNQEFDLADPEFHISESFLTRMTQLALLRHDEALVLITRLPQPVDAEPRTESLSIMEAFLEQLANVLSTQPERASLVNTLRDTRIILDHMEVSQSRAHDAEIGTTLAALGLHFSAENAPVIPAHHHQTLEDIRTAMVVAYKLNPISHNSDQLNAYARVSGNHI